jgi:uncharacterized protein
MHFRSGQLLLSPSDVTAFLGCRHSSALSLAVARGEIPPTASSGDAELVFSKGREHEAAYLARLRAEGLDVCEIVLGSPGQAPTPEDRDERSSTKRYSARGAGAA